MKIFFATALVGVVSLVIFPIQADNKKPAGIWLDDSSMAPLPLPASGDIPDSLERLEYLDEAIPNSFQKDLNSDGRVEYLIISAGSLCGTGGCPYILLDGKSLRRIGNFFGSPILVAAQKINSYPVIHVYSHASAGSGTFTTHVYDGHEYRAVSSVFLAGESVDALFKSFADYKKIVSPETGRDK
ncbi:MAG: hypothetical protein NTW95_06525 [Candidatus Aminicenantes bacterium]|nr:hypothetical protein [Candidatus Aminicenantes bacterium]